MSRIKKCFSCSKSFNKKRSNFCSECFGKLIGGGNVESRSFNKSSKDLVGE